MNHSYKIMALGQVRLNCVPKTPEQQKQLSNQEKKVDAIWLDCHQKTNCFNGTFFNFFNAVNYKNQYIVNGTFVEYKYLVAHRANANLNLSIMPIGVSGLISIHSQGSVYILFARRSAYVLDYANYLELVPSGAIDRSCLLSDGIVDYKSKLLEEFTEETHFPKCNISNITEFAFVFDTKKRIYDVCCEIMLDLPPSIVEKNFKASDEYLSPMLVSLDNVTHFCKEHVHEIVPTSLALVQAYLANCLDISPF